MTRGCATTSEATGTTTVSHRGCASRRSILTAPCPSRHEQPELLDVARARVELSGDPALVHHHDPVGEREDLVEVFADQETATPGRCLAQVRVHGFDRADIEPARRRRGDEHARLALELAGEDDLLQVPAGEPARRRVRPRRATS